MSADNSQKLNLAANLGQFARNKALDHIHQTGQGLPATVDTVHSSHILTVNFEMDGATYTLPKVKIAQFGPEYVRYPTQKGDKGVLIPMRVDIGNMTGLGPNNPSGFADAGNIGSQLIFMPVGNTNWASVDPHTLVMYGPKVTQSMGVLKRWFNKLTGRMETTSSVPQVQIMDSAPGTNSVTITFNKNGVTFQLPSNCPVTFSGTSKVTVPNGDVLAGPSNVSLLNHVHSGVTTGSGDTGAPVT